MALFLISVCIGPKEDHETKYSFSDCTLFFLIVIRLRQ